MRIANLSDMSGGWFIGDFTPSILKLTDCEVAVQRFAAGDQEKWHYHKIATEITVIVEGEAMMNGEKYTEGDIILLSPGEGTDFVAITRVTTVVVKLPSSTKDKYFDRS